ncbi:MAG: 6-bladed beta-propeller [Fibrobacterota bacterium]
MRTLLFLFSLIFLFSCTQKPTDVSDNGTGSEVGNAYTVSGKFYAATGAAVEGAVVHFVKVGYDPYNKTTAKLLAESDTVITDSTGTYGTNDLDPGTYNVYGEDDNGDVVLIDSVEITDDTTVIDSDTLDEPGSVAGFIKLEPGDEPDKIIAIVMGSNTFRIVNQDASFSLADLPEGEYNVKFFSTLDDYSNYDTSFSVTSGEVLNVPDSIVIPLKIPKVTGLTVDYDTMKQIVHLSWDRADADKVDGYNVYRRHIDSTDVKMNVQVLTDTVFSDSTGVQDEVYVYSVASVDQSDEEGVKTSTDSVEVVSGFELMDSIGTQGTGDGQFTIIRDMSYDAFGNLYVVSHENSSGDNPKIQKFDSAYNFLFSLDSQGTDLSAFMRPWGIAIDSVSNIYIADRNNSRIQIFDSNGTFINTIYGDITDSSNLESPRVLTVYNDQIYVADYSDSQYYSTVKVFDNNGAFISKWGEKGNGDGQFINIYAIKETEDGEIVTLDENGFQIFSATGTFIRSFDVSAYGSIPRDFDIANSIIYVSMYGGQIVLLDLQGQFISKLDTNDEEIFQIAVRKQDKEILVYTFGEHQIKIYM